MSQTCKIHWVSGKGGVGKSTFAYALGQQMAAQGERALVVEIGERSFFAYALDTSIAYEPVQVEEKLYVAHWEWQRCLREYVTHFIKIESLVKLFMENTVMRNIMAVAPGLAEIAILGKVTSGIRNVGPKFEWDHIILDAHSTGHTKAYLRAPMALHSAIGIGPLGQHAKGIDEVLLSKEHMNYYLVTLPEDLPTQETLSFHKEMKDEFNIDFKVVMNQYFTKDFFALSESISGDFASYIKIKKQKQVKAKQQLEGIGINRFLAFHGREKKFKEWVKDLREVSDELA